jgi:NADPH2:quinone reductase
VQAVTFVDGDIEVREHPDPIPSRGEILVRVRAAGLNSADLMQRRGGYAAPPGSPQDIPGLELAGEVIGLGPDAERFSLGDRVMALAGGGGQSELAVVHERLAMPVPTPLAWAEAGGLPEVFTTAHDALFTQALLASGDRVCVHGAAGGVGCAGVQLAVAAGATVTATVRNPDLRQEVAGLGARVLAPEEAVSGGPYDIILELIGGPNLPGDLESLAIGGRITVIGLGGGVQAEVNLGALMAKRARIMGSTLRVRPLEGKAVATRAVEAHVLPLFSSGRLVVPVAATFALSDAVAAYDRFAAGAKFGKVVLTMN